MDLHDAAHAAAVAAMAPSRAAAGLGYDVHDAAAEAAHRILYTGGRVIGQGVRHEVEEEAASLAVLGAVGLGAILLAIGLSRS